MKLKKVVIFGFKSFADKISLTFHDGITCIVGPNGCGKSNISDAMRWVFGEQSAKSLRGDKMTDVIFAGSANRKSLNLAEVTITFTDVNGVLPLDYNEISVTRRLHRSGESDYFINNQPVRLKDIQNIFLDTGVGRTAFSIFEQGKIDQIIQYSPIGRRILFEEAAGITRYLQRKKETLKKFEAIEQNLSRVSDIHHEVEKQIVKLEAQAKKAKIYQEDRKALETLEKAYLFAQYHHLHTKEQDSKENHTKASASLSSLQKKIEEKQSSYKALQKTMGQLELEKAQLYDDVQLKLSEQKVKKEKERLNKEHLKELQSKKVEYEKELTHLKSKKDEWLKEIDVCQKKLGQQEKEIKSASEEFSLKEKTYHDLEAELTKLRDTQAKNHKEKLLHLQRENQLSQDLKTLRIRYENHQEKKNQFHERQERLKILLKELEETEVQKKENFQQILKKNENLKEELKELDEKLKVSNEEIAELYKSIEILKKNLQEQIARKNALLRLKEDNEGFSAGSKKILKESKTPGSPLFGKAKPLYEFFSEENSEQDLAIILKRYSETIVVETYSDLKLLLDYTENKKIHDFSVVCLEAIDTDLKNHFLQKITYVDTIEEAFRTKNLERLTSNKLFVDSYHVVHVRILQENSIFIREAEIKELTKKIQEQQNYAEEKEKLLKEIKEKKNTFISKRNQLDAEIRSFEIQMVEANFSLQKVQNEKEKTKKEQIQVTQEIESSTISLNHLQQQSQELEQKLVEGRKVAETLLLNDTTLEQSLVKMLEERKKSIEELDSKRKALFQLNDEHKKLQHNLSLLEVKKQESENSKTRITDEISKNEFRIQQILSEEEEGKEREMHSEKLITEIQERISHLQEEIKNQKEALHQLSVQNDGWLKELKSIEKSVHHFEIQLAEARTAKEGIEKILQERFVGQEAPALSDISFEKAEKEIKLLRQKIDQAQDINLSAIEDYEKCKERYQFLQEQIQDLSLSKKELEDAIMALDAESREIFEKTFLTIKENFKKNFSLLFNGGEADLELVDSKDVLEAGVEIVAKPPGKQMRSLSLLSGGEKCLTAMALLFSIFEVKAAPFCILDEIDAPLDDSNIERFVTVVKQFIDRCQFIIITHNKQTMSIADRIFGVSMQEKGVSKLLSIEFDSEKEKSRELVEVV